jgi:predicted dehydrogenase/nucleoside-diphosphate-sugar epimerase
MTTASPIGSPRSSCALPGSFAALQVRVWKQSRIADESDERKPSCTRSGSRKIGLRMSSTAKRRTAIVGAGYISEYHVLPLRERRDVDIIAVVDPSEQARGSLARRFGIPAQYASVAELLATEQVDAAHVIVPPHLHVPVTRELLEGGVSCIVEKPFTTSSADADELIELAKAKGASLAVNHSQCGHPAFLELQARLAAGEIGPAEHVIAISNVPMRQLALKQFEGWLFAHPSHVLLEAAVHPLSLVHALLGPATDVRATGGDAVRLWDKRTFYKSWHANLRCERGSASVSMGFGRQYLEARIRVLGPDGALEADLVHGGVTAIEKTAGPDFLDSLTNHKKMAKAHRRSGKKAFWDYVLGLAKLRKRNDPFYASMRGGAFAFQDALAEQRTPSEDGVAGKHVVAMAEAIWKNSGLPEPEPDVPFDLEARRSAYEKLSGDEVLVIGSNGFIGGHLIEQLREKGYRVRAFLRRKGMLPPWLENDGVLPVYGTLGEEDKLREYVRGCRAVFHLATAMGNTWDETREHGIEASRGLARIAADEKVQRFVFTSTIAGVYLGDAYKGKQDGRVTENDGTDPQPRGRSMYARAKIESERVLQDVRKETGLPLVIHRPAVVLGRRGRPYHSGAGFWPNDRHCLGWGPGTTPVPFVLAQDVAGALILSIERDEAIGETFNLAGDVRPSARVYVERLADATGRQLVFHSQPLWRMQIGELFKWFVKFVVRKPGNEWPSYRDLKSRALRPWLDCTRAKELLGWQPIADESEFWNEVLHETLSREP